MPELMTREAEDLLAENQRLRAALAGVSVSDPDEDGHVWLSIRRANTSGGACFNLGHKSRVAAQVATLWGQDCQAAIAQV